jgi:hypothetical protein
MNKCIYKKCKQKTIHGLFCVNHRKNIAPLPSGTKDDKDED